VHRILETNGARLDMRFGGATLGETLLAPTQIYVKALLPLIEQGRVRALAHITGGGITGNLPRALPPFHRARIGAGQWTRPEIFDYLQREGRISDDEMLRVFNCGIGMALIADAADCDAIARDVRAHGLQARPIGEIEKQAEEEPCVIYD